MATSYMEWSSATERDFAEAAAKNHKYGSLNPRAQYRNELTVEEVLDSRCVSGPLTLSMCSPIGDGATALVLCSEEYAGRTRADEVRMLATALVSGQDGESPPAAEHAARKAYEDAGVGPEDLDVVELHDAAAPAELILYEQLGLCQPGDGPKLLGSGDTRLGGGCP